MNAPPASAVSPDSPSTPASGVGEKRRVPARWMLAVLGLTFLFVLMPFLFWQATWFGRPMNDTQLGKALSDGEHPRETQHALSQIADRILSPSASKRASARQFYPAVLAIGQSGSDELRLTAAWVMGQDTAVPEFHQQLARMLADANPMVRRNAALALVRSGDVAGRGEIRSMLAPSSVAAPWNGMLVERLRPGDIINPGTLIAHINAADRASNELRSQMPGTMARWLVADGSRVDAGQQILLVDPSEDELREALRALQLIGEQQDLAPVTALANHSSAAVRRQAQLSAQAIRSHH